MALWVAAPGFLVQMLCVDTRDHTLGRGVLDCIWTRRKPKGVKHCSKNMSRRKRSPSPTDATGLCTSSSKHKVKDHESDASTQQPFHFMDLPPELRNIIYAFAFCPSTEDKQDGEISAEPQLTAGLSNSTTARALSQVNRTVHQESMETFYSETTFVVRKLPDPFAHYEAHNIQRQFSSTSARPAGPMGADMGCAWSPTHSPTVHRSLRGLGADFDGGQSQSGVFR